MVVMIRSTNNIPRLVRSLEKLGHRTIKVGVFGEDNYKYGNDADLVTIAYVQEFGTTIRPKTADWLTIPMIPAAKNKRADDFPDLFFHKVDGDTAYLARPKGRDDIEIVFLLVKKVVIPERSFLRTGFDDNVDKIADKIEAMMNDVLNFDMNPDVFLDSIGREFAGLIIRHMRRITSPPNSGITSTVKRSANPLQDTGRLIGSIRHDVE